MRAAAKARPLDASRGELGRRVSLLVDEHLAHSKFQRQRLTVERRLGEDSGRKALVRTVGSLQRLLVRVDAEQTKHGSEELLLKVFVLLCDVLNHNRRLPVSVPEVLVLHLVVEVAVADVGR